MEHEFQINAALARFGLARHDGAERIGAGTLNQNFIVGTQRGKRVLRCIRADQPNSAVADEHAAIAWAAAHGIPVALPEPSTDPPDALSDEGLPNTCVALADRSRWAVFPFVEGRLARRGAHTAPEVAALGDMQGRLHSVLAMHPESPRATFKMLWSREHSLAALAEAERAAHSVNAADELIDAIGLQRKLLIAEPVQQPSAFAHLPCQMLHGDFHDEQVLFDAKDRIIAVLDWENFQGGARIWELVRSLAFSGLLDHPLLDTYLRGYSLHVQLSAEECALGIALWWQSRLIGTWVWTAYFVGGNQRLSPLFASTIETLNKLARSGWREATTQRFCNVAAAANARR